MRNASGDGLPVKIAFVAVAVMVIGYWQFNQNSQGEKSRLGETVESATALRKPASQVNEGEIHGALSFEQRQLASQKGNNQSSGRLLPDELDQDLKSEIVNLGELLDADDTADMQSDGPVVSLGSPMDADAIENTFSDGAYQDVASIGDLMSADDLDNYNDEQSGPVINLGEVMVPGDELSGSYSADGRVEIGEPLDVDGIN